MTKQSVEFDYSATQFAKVLLNFGDVLNFEVVLFF